MKSNAMTNSFAADVLPLFRSKDILCMGNMDIRLNEYQYMSDATGDSSHIDHANARHVLGHLSGDELPKMPPGGPAWSQEKLDTLKGWIDAGCAP